MHGIDATIFKVHLKKHTNQAFKKFLTRIMDQPKKDDLGQQFQDAYNQTVRHSHGPETVRPALNPITGLLVSKSWSCTSI